MTATRYALVYPPPTSNIVDPYRIRPSLCELPDTIFVYADAPPPYAYANSGSLSLISSTIYLAADLVQLVTCTENTCCVWHSISQLRVSTGSGSVAVPTNYLSTPLPSGRGMNNDPICCGIYILDAASIKFSPGSGTKLSVLFVSASPVYTLRSPSIATLSLSATAITPLVAVPSIVID